MLKQFLKGAALTKLVDSVRLSGMTIAEHLKTNTDNGKRLFKALYNRAKRSDVEPERFTEQLEKAIKTRKRNTLYTLKNIMSGVRGRARAIQAGGKSGTWYNNGVLDANTTTVCARYAGASWSMPYADIPDKPPRVGEIPHPCRSSLVFVGAGEGGPDEKPFMQQFNDDESLQYELLGETRFNAYQEGKLKISSFADYEKSVLNTIDELGIRE